MKRIFVSILLVLSLVLSSVPALAVTQDEISKQNSQIEALKKEINELDTQINQLESQINNLNNEISKSSEDLLQAQQEEAELKEQSIKRIRAAYMYGTDGYVNYLFSAENPSDFISYYDIAKDILKADKDTSDQLKAKREQIEQLQKKLTEDRTNLVNTKKQAETTVAQKQETLSKNQTLVAQLEKQLDEQETKSSANSANTTTETPIVEVSPAVADSVTVASSTPIILEQSVPDTTTTTRTVTTTEEIIGVVPTDDNASSAMTLPRFITQLAGNESGITSDMIAIPDASGSSIIVASGELMSTWVWPIDANDPNAFLITSLMGTRESPGGIGSTDHGGTDIGASYGTPILAAQSGTVTISGSYSGYGNAVQIDHGNGYETLYGHMSSIAVSKGDYVEAGQIIGFVGSTGWSTGPHLHFEVHYTDSTGQTTKINGLSLYGQNIYDRLSYYY